MREWELSDMGDTIDSRDIIARYEALSSELTDRWEEHVSDLLDIIEEMRDVARDEGRLLDVEDGEDISLYAEARDHDPHCCAWLRFREDFDAWVSDVADADQHEFHEDAEEYLALAAIIEQGEGYGDWACGEPLIAEDYFPEYVQEMVEECYNLKVPDFVKIDWAGTAENVRVDYTEIDVAGNSYWMRT